jgi:hypothetical protein
MTVIQIEQFVEFPLLRTKLWGEIRKEVVRLAPTYVKEVRQLGNQNARAEIVRVQKSSMANLRSSQPNWDKIFENWYLLLEHLLDTQMNLRTLKELDKAYLAGPDTTQSKANQGVWANTFFDHWALQGKATIERWRVLLSSQGLAKICSRAGSKVWTSTKDQHVKDAKTLEKRFAQLRHDTAHGGGEITKMLRTDGHLLFTVAIDLPESIFFESFNEAHMDRYPLRKQIVPMRTAEVVSLIERQAFELHKLIP